MRVDAPVKTQGRARYAAEFMEPGTVHVSMVTSTIAKGRVTGFDTREAGGLPGVIAIITTDDAFGLHVTKASKQTITEPLLQNDHVRFQGQPVALVLAETIEAAQHAASLVIVRYERAGDAVTDMQSALPDAYHPKNFRDGSLPADSHRGDPDGAFRGADVRIEAVYETPA